MTEAEIEALMAPFPDSVVEVRPHDGLVYIPHIHVSDRLNRVFKPGKWSMVCRRHWLDGLTMYGEYILLIRGCYVGESVGGHPYQPNNPKVNYSDTLESTAAEALRRIAGKRLSCGWQVWDPSYANQWCEKYRGQQNGNYFKKSMASAPPAPKTSPAPAAPKITTAKMPTPETRKWMIGELKADGPNRKVVEEYFQKVAQLLPNEKVEELPLRFVPFSKQELEALVNCLSNFEAGGDAVRAFDPHGEADAPAKKPVEVPRETAKAPGGEESPASGEDWYGVIVPIPHKNQKRDEYLKNPDTIGSLYDARHDDDEARKRLWGFSTNYEPKGWTGKDGKERPASASDVAFRASLDQFVEWFENNHPDEKL